MSYDPTDPRLTAYALGEMPAEERLAFESSLDEEDVAEIAAIRELAALLREGLAEEPMPSLTEPQRQAIHQRACAPVRRQFRWVVWLAAAASFAVLAALFRPAPRSQPILATQFVDKDDAREGRYNAFSGAKTEMEGLPPQAEAAPSLRAKDEVTGFVFDLAEQNRPAERKGEKLLEDAEDMRPRQAAAPPKASAPAPLPEPTREQANAPAAAPTDALAMKPAEPPRPVAAPAKAVGVALEMPQEAARNEAMGDLGGAAAIDSTFLAVRDAPVSQFSIVAPPAADRRLLADTEAMGRSVPARRDRGLARAPLSANVQLAPCPWEPAHWLARLTIQGRNLADATVQVDFQPSQVVAYRLAGQGNEVPILRDAEASVLYELIPAEKAAGGGAVTQPLPLHHRMEIAVGTQRDGEPGRTESVIANVEPIAELEGDFAYAAAVAAYTMIQSGSPLRGTASLELIEKLAHAGLGQETEGPRHQFLEQVRQARAAER